LDTVFNSGAPVGLDEPVELAELHSLVFCLHEQVVDCFLLLGVFQVLDQDVIQRLELFDDILPFFRLPEHRRAMP
jgi:hypothetical protein